jgi:hypothetical protein
MVTPYMWNLTVDTHGLDDEDEPSIDVCYISDMLVNMIAADALQLGFTLCRYVNIR